MNRHALVGYLVLALAFAFALGYATHEGDQAIAHADRNRCIAVQLAWDFSQQITLDLTQHIPVPPDQATDVRTVERYDLANIRRDGERAQLQQKLGPRPPCTKGHR